ncbi:MAG: FecR domain-containing protein [Bacteroidota bacterium]
MNKDFEHIIAEELAADSHFKNWILGKKHDDNSYWEDFLRKYPHQKGVYEEAKAMVLAVHTHFDQEEISPSTLNQQFDQLLADSKTKSLPIKGGKIKRIPWLRRLSVAAVVLFLLFSGFWYWNSNQMKVYATAYGEWKSIELPDGSRVELNSNSRIKLANSWLLKDSRDVWLEGEAFFEVKNMRESGKKFQVMTEDLKVQVLGTSFNVHSRGEQTEVFLEEGEIKLDLGEEEDLMAPGNWIAYSKEDKKIEKKEDARGEEISSWKNGVLVMKNATTQEIFEELSEIYGVEIVLTDEKMHQTGLTIRVPMKQLEIAIPILENTLGKKIKQENKRLLIQ